jgi:cbb3-type cytochrome oxidase subunit 3
MDKIMTTKETVFIIVIWLTMLVIAVITQAYHMGVL